MVELEIDDKTLQRYQDVYGMRAKPPADRVVDHWLLEKQLRQELLSSNQVDRTRVAENAYTTLYKNLQWHDELSSTIEGSDNLSSWLFAIPDGTREIYEVGSGQGRLLKEFAKRGYHCCGTEITSNRGEKYVSDQEGLCWASSDGVHIDRYEGPESYDVVISNQVVEHLHPEDIAEHFSSIQRVLRPGGRYLVSTPHRVTGPHDVSKVFNSREAAGLHLKEYDWKGLASIAKASGFDRVTAATLFRANKLAPTSALLRATLDRSGAGYLGLMILQERLLDLIPGYRLRTALARFLKSTRVFSDNIFLSCERLR